MLHRQLEYWHRYCHICHTDSDQLVDKTFIGRRGNYLASVRGHHLCRIRNRVRTDHKTSVRQRLTEVFDQVCLTTDTANHDVNILT